MSDNIELDPEVLLPWFMGRMSTDEWCFVLLLDTGHTMHISHINRIDKLEDGSVWLDVEMATEPFYKTGRDIFAPTSRTSASVNLAHVVAAYEAADT